MTDLEAYLILNAISGIGPKRAVRLIEHCGSPQAVLKASYEQFNGIEDVPDHAILNLINFPKDKFLYNEFELIQSKQVVVICKNDKAYPELLKEISDAPLVLYVQGNPQILNEPSIAIVGSRRASLYGLGIAQSFATQMAQSGLCIVSGMARGIDTAAHQGALRARGITAAVLGCGLNHIYPPENAQLAQAIKQSGAVVSEFPMETPPASFNFPRRNRIISGLSQGVLVVEAALKSGALITSDFAIEQGRDVFAVPGKVGESAAQGTNHLIQQGAKLVTSTNDILQDLSVGLSRFCRSSQEVSEDVVDPSLSEDEKNVCTTLKNEVMHIDELADKSGISVVEAALVLFKLQLKKIVRQLPGQKYQKQSRGDNGKIISHR